MLDRIKAFFDDRILQEGDEEKDREHRLRLATAALLTEVMLIDGEHRQDEQEALRRLLESQYGLSGEECRELADLAQEEVGAATSLYQFTALIDRHFSPAEKERLMISLWELAYADDELDKYEEATIRKIAELIHLPHTAFIQAKHTAKKL